jgi:hypothetical protein
MRQDWLRSKAAYYAEAWRRSFGVVPTLHNVALGCSVAAHETICGDAWRGPDGELGTADDENNWGACTLRSLNAAEKAVIAKAGIVPTVGKGHEERARAAMRALSEAGIPPASGTIKGLVVPRATIHCDSLTDGTGLHPYFVWFANFATPVDGARYFQFLLVGQQKQKQAAIVLEHDAGNEAGLAAAMYAAGYFKGFYDPAKIYEDGATGRQKNIDAYANRIRAFRPQFTAALTGEPWPPPMPPDPPLLTSEELKRIAFLINATALEAFEDARAYSIADRDREITGNDPADALMTEQGLSMRDETLEQHDTEPEMAAVHTGDTERPEKPE